ncbi:Hypothetical predicted protein [Lecanosticta acicola]|uniref:Tautomerase cis-CaaD-like domain-containing protein n=1 Tax=Lecanosticta acicola TaxID=111012 RepID=A0AAI8Z0L8_9PEZI|nr:Hypothetical predicted protein [Lecanosticta acicola]
MPLYDVQHICPLTAQQQDDLAEAITVIHSQKFTTPRMFVNVKFTDNTLPNAPTTYVAGKRRAGNHIFANVRVGPSRTQKDWNNLTNEIVEAWNRVVPMPVDKRNGHSAGKGVDYELRACILLGGMIGGYEAGFLIPKAGEDVQWMKDNWEEFQMKAQSGDELFAEMVEEIQTRGLLEGAGKSGKEKLEEALGWGDSA